MNRATLLEALDEGLDACRAGRRVTDVCCRPAEYYSSHELHDLVVTLDDGSRLSVVLKDLTPGVAVGAAAGVKPPFLSDPGREPWAYSVLDAFAVEAPRCVGYFAREPSGPFLLFLEKVRGVPLWQSGDLAAWQAAARWAAVAHGKLRTTAGAPKPGPLISYSADYYALWPQRVASLVVERNQADPRARRLGAVLHGYGRVIDRLTRLPRTMIHGEYYASNILVDTCNGSPRVVPVDWEMAGIGPGLMDLADLIAGKWSDAERQSIVHAYREAAPPDLLPPDPSDFDAALDACRLHKAIQWLGWSADWRPPKEHRHDWLAEALRLADQLGLT